MRVVVAVLCLISVALAFTVQREEPDDYLTVEQEDFKPFDEENEPRLFDDEDEYELGVADDEEDNEPGFLDDEPSVPDVEDEKKKAILLRLYTLTLSCVFFPFLGFSLTPPVSLAKQGLYVPIRYI